jgi:hypothetical protein
MGGTRPLKTKNFTFFQGLGRSWRRREDCLAGGSPPYTSMGYTAPTELLCTTVVALRPATCRGLIGEMKTTIQKRIFPAQFESDKGRQTALLSRFAHRWPLGDVVVEMRGPRRPRLKIRGQVDGSPQHFGRIIGRLAHLGASPRF